MPQSLAALRLPLEAMRTPRDEVYHSDDDDASDDDDSDVADEPPRDYPNLLLPTNPLPSIVFTQKLRRLRFEDTGFVNHRKRKPKKLGSYANLAKRSTPRGESLADFARQRVEEAFAERFPKRKSCWATLFTVIVDPDSTTAKKSDFDRALRHQLGLTVDLVSEGCVTALWKDLADKGAVTVADFVGYMLAHSTVPRPRPAVVKEAAEEEEESYYYPRRLRRVCEVLAEASDGDWQGLACFDSVGLSELILIVRRTLGVVDHLLVGQRDLEELLRLASGSKEEEIVLSVEQWAGWMKRNCTSLGKQTRPLPLLTPTKQQDSFDFDKVVPNFDKRSLRVYKPQSSLHHQLSQMSSLDLNSIASAGEVSQLTLDTASVSYYQPVESAKQSHLRRDAASARFSRRERQYAAERRERDGRERKERDVALEAAWADVGRIVAASKRKRDDGSILGELAAHWEAFRATPRSLDLSNKNLHGGCPSEVTKLLTLLDSFDLRGNKFTDSELTSLIATRTHGLSKTKHLRLDHKLITKLGGRAQRLLREDRGPPPVHGVVHAPPLLSPATPAVSSRKAKFLLLPSSSNDDDDDTVIIPAGLVLPELQELSMPRPFFAPKSKVASSLGRSSPARCLGLGHLQATSLRRLALPGQRLDGLSLESLLGELSAVKTTLSDLNLAGCKCGGTLRGIEGFQSLRELFLSDCALTGDVSILLELPAGLKLLALQHNELSGELPRETLTMLPKKMRSLYLHANLFSGPTPEAPEEPLLDLEQLWLQSNSSLEPPEWSEYVLLEKMLPNTDLQLDKPPEEPLQSAEARWAEAPFFAKAQYYESALLDRGNCEPPSQAAIRLALIAEAILQRTDLKRVIKKQDLSEDSEFSQRDISLIWEHACGELALATPLAMDAEGFLKCLDSIPSTFLRIVTRGDLQIAVEEDVERQNDPLNTRPGEDLGDEEAVSSLVRRLVRTYAPRNPLKTLATLQDCSHDDLRKILRDDFKMPLSVLPEALLNTFLVSLTNNNTIPKAEISVLISQRGASSLAKVTMANVETLLKRGYERLIRQLRFNDWLALLNVVGQRIDSKKFVEMSKTELQVNLPVAEIARYFNALVSRLATDAAYESSLTPRRLAAYLAQNVSQAVNLKKEYIRGRQNRRSSLAMGDKPKLARLSTMPALGTAVLGTAVLARSQLSSSSLRHVYDNTIPSFRGQREPALDDIIEPSPPKGEQRRSSMTPGFSFRRAPFKRMISDRKCSFTAPRLSLPLQLSLQ